MAVEETGGDVVVAVAEDGGGDGDLVAEDAAGGVAAAVDRRLDRFDDDALTAFSRFHSLGFLAELDDRALERAAVHARVCIQPF